MPSELVHIVADHALTVGAPEAWAIIGNFGDATALGDGFVLRVDSLGEGVGATRTLHLLPEMGGGKVVERQAARDEAGMYYAYELADAGPLPMLDYYGSVHVIPVSANACRVTWTNRYRVADAAGIEAMRAQSLMILESIERNLRVALGLPVGLGPDASDAQGVDG
jgi:hypothetical protein